MIKSIGKTARILDVFRENRELSLKELTSLTGFNKTTTHGLVHTMLAERLLAQDAETRRYSLGPALFELGELYRQRIDAFAICRPYMRELSQESDLTVQLAILADDSVLYLSRVVTREFLGFAAADGVRVPAYCTASGKAMLSLLPDGEIDRIYPDERLPARTPNTIASRALLKKELAAIRSVGYAVDRQEAEVGLAGLAAGFKADRLMAISMPCQPDVLEQPAITELVEKLLHARDQVQSKFQM